MKNNQTINLSAEVYWTKRITNHLKELWDNSQAGDEFVGEILEQYQTGIPLTAEWYVKKLATQHNEAVPNNLDYEVIGTLIEGFVAFLKEKHNLLTQKSQ